VNFFIYVHATKLKANINDGFATTSQNDEISTTFTYISPQYRGVICWWGAEGVYGPQGL